MTQVWPYTFSCNVYKLSANNAFADYIITAIQSLQNEEDLVIYYFCAFELSLYKLKGKSI